MGYLGLMKVEDAIKEVKNSMPEQDLTTQSAMATLLTHLENYIQLEEQGLLLRLPCKVGDKVYADSNCFGILEYEVDEIIINGDKITFLCSAYSTPIGDCPSECLDEIEPYITDFGKTVFLTKEEAE